jgi:hypothetical protein
MNIKEGTPFLDVLLGDMFTRPWSVSTDANAGKAAPTIPSLNPGLNLARKYWSYEKPYCESALVDCGVDALCDTGTPTVETTGYIYSDINKCKTEKWTIGAEEFVNLCEGPAERRADYLRRKAWNIKQKVNRDAIETLYLAIANYNDGLPSIGAGTRNVTILSSKGDISPVGLQKIESEYDDIGYMGGYKIFGGKVLSTFYGVDKWRLSPEGRLGTELNSDSLPFIYDKEFDKVFQTLEGNAFSHAVTVPFGSYGIHFWNKYTGVFETNTPTLLTTTLEIDGLLYDYSVKYDECLFQWTETLTLRYGFLGIPDSAYCNGIGLIKHWNIGCGDIDCDSFC